MKARPAGVSAAAMDSSHPTPGQVLAERYVLLERIGEGGGGTVYRAYDRELNIQVALKILTADKALDVLLKRLKREIRITRDIEHPNVSRVFDLGEADGLTFLTMRWIDGEPLHRRVRQKGPLGTPQLDRLARGLVSALAAAHRLGVVHRDVKPANVLVSSSGDPVLVDFGVATDQGTSPTALVRRGERITPVGGIPGTPAFMSPEQVRGEPSQPPADLWSLALTVLYAAEGDVRRPERPERAFGRLPRPLPTLLAQCLEEDPARRPRDAVVLEEAIQRAARRRRALRVAGIFALVLAIAVTAAVTIMGRTVRTSPAAETPLVWVATIENSTGDPDLSWLGHGVGDLLRAEFESSEHVRLALDPAARERAARVSGTVRREEGSVAVRLLLTGPDGQVRARGLVADATGDALFAGVDQAARRFFRALGVREGRGGASATNERPWLPTFDVEAFGLYQRAQEHVRKHRYLQALELLRIAVDRDRDFAVAHLWRALLAVRHGSNAEAIAAFERALASRGRLPPGEAAVLDAWRETRAKNAYPARIDRLRAHLRAHPPVGGLYFLSTLLPSLAASQRRTFLEEWAERLPDDPEPHNQLGYLLFVTYGDPEEAEREFLEYLRLAPDDANAHDSYADFLRERDRLDDADREYEAALRLDPGFISAAVDWVDVALRRDDLVTADVRAAHARPLLRPSHRDFSVWVIGYVAIPLIAGDTRDAFRRLEEIRQDPAVGSKSFLAWEHEAILRGVRGELVQARRAAEEANRASALYHGAEGQLPTLRTYVEGLAAFRRRDVRALERSHRDLAVVPSGAEPGRVNAREALVAGLLATLTEEPSVAAEKLRIGRTQRLGVSFLAAMERGRALVRAGRMEEARGAYEEAMDERRAVAATPEAAWAWRDCLREAQEIARTLGDHRRVEGIEVRLGSIGAWDPAATPPVREPVPAPSSRRTQGRVSILPGAE